MEQNKRELVVVRGEPASAAPAGVAGEPAPPRPPGLVGEPGKLLRIAGMVREMLAEVRRAPMDEQGRRRLREVHERSVTELKEVLAPELQDELEAVTIPFEDGVPSESELRVAQAQLTGWLEGLFHGIQAALAAQQMQAQMQLGELRRKALGPGGEDPMGSPGQYL